MTHELVLRVPRELVETVSDLLADDAGALSVSVEDADADSGDEQPLFGEPGLPAPAPGWERSTLRALFDDEALADAAAVLALARHRAGGLALETLAPVADQDWVRLTQAQWQPVGVTADLWIVPSWHTPPAEARQVIRLDPGLAFGTGTHPTTRMCLRWLALQPGGPRPGRVLDYGCGSGILAIGAALLGWGLPAAADDTPGAAQIDAVDIDPAAVETAEANAARNGVGLRCGLPELAEGRYGLVLANILATPLKLLAPLLTAHLAPGGTLVLAGMLERQASELQAAYRPALSLVVSDAEDGWILMTAQAP